MGPRIRMFPRERNKSQGWGLFEVLLALALSAIITGVVAMGARQALDSANAHDCSKNLALIEAAKDEFTRDNPGVPLTSESQLAKYLKYGIPTCPSGGAYSHVLDLTAKTTCSLGTNSNKANYHTLVP
jgi:type II secretory pathway pseudopilin PulG